VSPTSTRIMTMQRLHKFKFAHQHRTRCPNDECCEYTDARIEPPWSGWDQHGPIRDGPVVWWGKKAQARDQRRSGATIAIRFSRATEFFHLAPSNTLAAHGSQDGTTRSLLLMVVDTCPIRLQQPIVQRVQQRREQTHSGSFLDRSGHETDQPLSSVVRSRLGPSDGCSSDRKMSSLLQPPPAMEGSQRMHDKVASFLQDKFMEDALEWNEFSRDCAHVGSLSNAALLRIYWFAQGRLETWVGSRLPKLNNKKMEIVSWGAP
jgi:hypothetical protein